MSYLFEDENISKICKILYISDEIGDRKKLLKIIRERISETIPTPTKKKTTISQIGVDGRDGKVYKIKYDKNPQYYALKQFSDKKPIDQIRKEVLFLKQASDIGIAPNIIEYNLEKKYIVMELLDQTLFDVLNKTKGQMSDDHQRKIVEIMKKLDKIGIYHADPSPLNFMFKGDDIKIIDFGMSEIIDSSYIKKNKTKEPNLDFMLLGFILQMKSLGVDVNSNYSFMKRFISSDKLKQCGIIKPILKSDDKENKKEIKKENKKEIKKENKKKNKKEIKRKLKIKREL